MTIEEAKQETKILLENLGIKDAAVGFTAGKKGIAVRLQSFSVDIDLPNNVGGFPLDIIVVDKINSLDN